MKNQKINTHSPIISTSTPPSSLSKPDNTSQYNYPHQFITAYGPKTTVRTDVSAARDRTKQSFKDECDINHIMARYQKTGVLDFAQKHAPQYGDCTGVEFQAGMQKIAQARSMFEELPSKLRLRFSNDPAEFLEFVQNPANREEAKELGLLKPELVQGTPVPPPPRRRGTDDGSVPREGTPTGPGGRRP